MSSSSDLNGSAMKTAEEQVIKTDQAEDESMQDSSEQYCPYANSSNDEGDEESDEDDGSTPGPELTRDIKMKLMYTDTPFSDDHMLWCHALNAAVTKAKKRLLDLKNELEKARSQGKFDNTDLIRKLEEQEELFAKQHIKKVVFDKSLPPVEPMPEEVRANVHRLKRKEVYPLKVVVGPAQSKMRIRLRKLRRYCNILKSLENKHLPDVENYLYTKEIEFKEKYMVPKTPQELEDEEKELVIKNTPPPKTWLSELSDEHKKKLMYTRASRTNDHVFWVDAMHSEVIDARRNLAELKKKLNEATAKGSEEEKVNAEKVLREEEDKFVQVFINKAEFDDTLPEVTPLCSGLRVPMYEDKEKIYKILWSKEQAQMLKTMRQLKKNLKKMDRQKNKFTPNVANTLFNKEIEYKKKFLVIDPEVEKQILDEAALKKPRDRYRRRQNEGIGKNGGHAGGPGGGYGGGYGYSGGEGGGGYQKFKSRPPKRVREQMKAQGYVGFGYNNHSQRFRPTQQYNKQAKATYGQAQENQNYHAYSDTGSRFHPYYYRDNY